MKTLIELVVLIEELAGSNDLAALIKVVDDFIAKLPKEPGAIEASLAKRVLVSLRKNRRFEQLRVVAQAILDDGCDDPLVHKFFAQALIDTGETSPAIGLLTSLTKEKYVPESEWADAKGVLGRAWKDRAVKSRPTRPAVARRALQEAVSNYRDVYLEDKSRLYQGINFVALASWDSGEVLSSKELAVASEAALDIFRRVQAIPDNDRTTWDYAIAGESLVAQGNLEEAAKWFSKYATHDATNSFELAGTVRQLMELWKLSDSVEGNNLLTPLRARLLELPGGQITISKTELVSMEKVTQENYEKVLGDIGPTTFTFIQHGFEVARSVVLIRQNGRGMGTGFLVRGGDLNSTLGDELFVLTNSHVVSDPPKLDAASPDEVTLTLELAASPEDAKARSVKEIVWQSPPEEFDVSVLRLSPAIRTDYPVLAISKTLPVLGEKQRIFIIGHPGGGEISFSYGDNELLDYETRHMEDEDETSPCRIHYRTPTEKGNSGSPVFNANWRAIGIHHKGSTEMPKLNGKKGIYAANEGIWIESIKRAIRKSLGNK